MKLIHRKITITLLAFIAAVFSIALFAGVSAEEAFAKTAPPQKKATIADGTYLIRSALVNKVLDVKGASKKSGALVQMASPGKAKKSQQYKITFNKKTGYYSIVNVNAAKALNVKGNKAKKRTAVQIYKKSGTRAQKWLIKATKKGSKKYRIISAAGGYSLSIKNASEKSGAKLQIFSKTSHKAQIWKFTKLAEPKPDDKPVANPITTKNDLEITLKTMLTWQRNGNKYIKDISDASILAALDPAKQTGGYYYQFADLRKKSGLTATQINAYISSTASGRSGKLKGLGSAFVSAANTYNINETYLLAHAILESGWGTSTLAKGYAYNGKDEVNGKTYPKGTYYNFYGIGAVDSGPLSGGRALAIQNGWNTPTKAVTGAAKWINSGYIRRTTDVYAQPTLYLMKWDYLRSADNKAYGWHQYATTITWARDISSLMNSCYSYSGVNPSLNYIVPVYKK